MNDATAAREAAELARAALDGRIDILEACARIAPLQWRLPRVDPGVMETFVAIGSELDGKPVLAGVRQLWSPEALAQKDVGLQRYRSAVGDELKKALAALVVQLESSE